MSPVSNQCLTCRHFRLGGSCDVFETIPTEIITGEFDHRKAYPGDNGVRWAEWPPSSRKEK